MDNAASYPASVAALAALFSAAAFFAEDFPLLSDPDAFFPFRTESAGKDAGGFSLSEPRETAVTETAFGALRGVMAETEPRASDAKRKNALPDAAGRTSHPAGMPLQDAQTQPPTVQEGTPETETAIHIAERTAATPTLPHRKTNELSSGPGGIKTARADNAKPGFSEYRSERLYPADALLLGRFAANDAGSLAELSAYSAAAELSGETAGHVAFYADVSAVSPGGGAPFEADGTPNPVRGEAQLGADRYDPPPTRTRKSVAAEARLPAAAQTEPYAQLNGPSDRSAAFGQSSPAAMHRYGGGYFDAPEDGNVWTQLSAFGELMNVDREDRKAAGYGIRRSGAPDAFSPLPGTRKSEADRSAALSAPTEEAPGAGDAGADRFGEYLSDFISGLRAALTASPDLTYGA